MFVVVRWGRGSGKIKSWCMGGCLSIGCGRIMGAVRPTIMIQLYRRFRMVIHREYIYRLEKFYHIRPSIKT